MKNNWAWVTQGGERASLIMIVKLEGGGFRENMSLRSWLSGIDDSPATKAMLHFAWEVSGPVPISAQGIQQLSWEELGGADEGENGGGETCLALGDISTGHMYRSPEESESTMIQGWLSYKLQSSLGHKAKLFLQLICPGKSWRGGDVCNGK